MGEERIVGRTIGTPRSIDSMMASVVRSVRKPSSPDTRGSCSPRTTAQKCRSCSFNAARGPASRIRGRISSCQLGEPGRGLALIFGTLGRIRLAHIGARALGLSRRLLDAMAAYANERRQFGRPIGDFQLVQQMIADSAMELASARLLLLHTAWRIDRGEPAREGISMVKVQASETLGRIADRAVQIFGGAGYCKDQPIESTSRSTTAWSRSTNMRSSAIR